MAKQMDWLIVGVWLLSMVIYSFSSDYATRFAQHAEFKPNKALTGIRWGSLLMAMALSAVIAQRYQSHLQGAGLWIFVMVVFAVILLSKLIFRFVVLRKR